MNPSTLHDVVESAPVEVPKKIDKKFMFGCCGTWVSYFPGASDPKWRISRPPDRWSIPCIPEWTALNITPCFHSLEEDVDRTKTDLCLPLSMMNEGVHTPSTLPRMSTSTVSSEYSIINQVEDLHRWKILDWLLLINRIVSFDKVTRQNKNTNVIRTSFKSVSHCKSKNIFTASVQYSHGQL